MKRRLSPHCPVLPPAAEVQRLIGSIVVAFARLTAITSAAGLDVGRARSMEVALDKAAMRRPADLRPGLSLMIHDCARRA